MVEVVSNLAGTGLKLVREVNYGEFMRGFVEEIDFFCAKSVKISNSGKQQKI
jgi:hypothetical protein